MMTNGMAVLKITRMQENVTGKAVTHSMIDDTLMKTPTLAVFVEIPHPHVTRHHIHTYVIRETICGIIQAQGTVAELHPISTKEVEDQPLLKVEKTDTPSME